MFWQTRDTGLMATIRHRQRYTNREYGIRNKGQARQTAASYDIRQRNATKGNAWQAMCARTHARTHTAKALLLLLLHVGKLPFPLLVFVSALEALEKASECRRR